MVESKSASMLLKENGGRAFLPPSNKDEKEQSRKSSQHKEQAAQGRERAAHGRERVDNTKKSRRHKEGREKSRQHKEEQAAQGRERADNTKKRSNTKIRKDRYSMCHTKNIRSVLSALPVLTLKAQVRVGLLEEK